MASNLPGSQSHVIPEAEAVAPLQTSTYLGPPIYGR